MNLWKAGFIILMALPAIWEPTASSAQTTDGMASREGGWRSERSAGRVSEGRSERSSEHSSANRGETSARYSTSSRERSETTRSFQSREYTPQRTETSRSFESGRVRTAPETSAYHSNRDSGREARSSSDFDRRLRTSNPEPVSRRVIEADGGDFARTSRTSRTPTNLSRTPRSVRIEGAPSETRSGARRNTVISQDRGDAIRSQPSGDRVHSEPSGDRVRSERSGERVREHPEAKTPTEGRDAQRVEPRTRIAEPGQPASGPIPPSEWRAYRQQKIENRRSQRRDDTVEGHEPGDGHDGDHDGHDGDDHRPESFNRHPKSPAGPVAITREGAIQLHTRPHQHHDGCGHYQYDGGWHDFPKEHHHHDGCGHYRHNGDWHSWPRGHVHRPGCGHYFHDHDWFDFPIGHRHGRHCGHYYYDGIWHLFPRVHVHSSHCGHYFYYDSWHYWPRTHFHYPGCGHYYFNSFWYPFPPSYYGYTETVVVYGGTSSAVTSYRSGGSSYAESPDAVERGYERSARGDYYGAIAAFSSAIASTPDNGPIYLALGIAYMEAGDTRAAYNRIMEGLRRTPDLAEGHPDLEGLIPDPQQVEWFIGSLEQNLAENPENSRASMVLGYLKFLRRDYEGAKLCLQATAALEPDNEEARRLLDFIYEIESLGT